MCSVQVNIAFFIAMQFDLLFMRVVILLTWGKHLQDRINDWADRINDWAHKTA